MADPHDHDPDRTAPPDAAETPGESIDEARRRLLSLSRYVPPAVLGILVLDGMGCQPAPSCNPATCNPSTNGCNPDNNPCNPDGGPCGPDNCGPNNP